ncbi:terminase small subunit [Zoogloea sp.]|uniref:terminase small subunit n=1 Tax=Zoogloea sp. TaxID=49181 RepID=UPI0035B4B96B
MNKQVTQDAFAGLVGVSQKTVSLLLSRGVLTPRATCSVWLREYCEHLRAAAEERAAEGGANLVAERARLAKEQADRLAMQNAISRRELAPRPLLESILVKSGRRAASILNTIPGQVQKRLPMLTSVDVEAIAREVAKASHIVSSMTLADVDGDANEDEADDAFCDENADVEGPKD